MFANNFSPMNGFQFKQFFVAHDQCAMKVGTDGVLLGAWCPLDFFDNLKDNPINVLDIGTGSGLIALMIAQRLENRHLSYKICGIDIDESATNQAKFNFEESPWRENLQSNHISLQNLSFRQSSFYDLIISNPPFFVNSLKNPDKSRELARHTDTLSYKDLIEKAAYLLKPQGFLALILPAGSESEILDLANHYGLQLRHITRVFPKPSKPVKRILIAFQKPNEPSTNESSTQNDSSTNELSTKEDSSIIKEDSLYIESSVSPRSEQYALLTKDFYL